MAVDLPGPGHAEGPERPLGRSADDLSFAQLILGGPGREPSIGQVPQLLDPVPPGHRDPALYPENIEHPLDVPAGGPAAGDPAGPGTVLEVPQHERTRPPQVGQDVPTEPAVLPEPCFGPAAVRVPVGGVAPHQEMVDRIVLGQDDRGSMRPVFEQPPLLP